VGIFPEDIGLEARTLGKMRVGDAGYLPARNDPVEAIEQGVVMEHLGQLADEIRPRRLALVIQLDIRQNHQTALARNLVVADNVMPRFEVVLELGMNVPFALELDRLPLVQDQQVEPREQTLLPGIQVLEELRLRTQPVHAGPASRRRCRPPPRRQTPPERAPAPRRPEAGAPRQA
jgi:hypothetical protein